jgi:hypothetical protein
VLQSKLHLKRDEGKSGGRLKVEEKETSLNLTFYHFPLTSD